MEIRKLNMPAPAAVAFTATGSRIAVCNAFQTTDSLFNVLRTAVSVRSILGPEMVDVWNRASRRMVIAVRWNTGFFFMTP
ncbi:MAG: hypothetical protein VW644_13840 [Alphaproteobacteria bacterium]